MPKNITRKILIALLLTVLTSISSVFVPLSAAATSTFQVKTSYFESFTGDYYLEKDENGSSTLRVVEEIVAVFPEDSEEHGITRQIIYTGPTDVADNKTLDLKATRNGQPENIARINLEKVPSSLSNNAHYFDVRVGSAAREVSGRQVYTLEYTYHNVIDEMPDLDDMQELYWNANGTGWSKPIRELIARVHFGEGIAKKFTGNVACFVGKYGDADEDRCEASKIEDGVEFKTVKKSLAASENLTFAVGFKTGTFKVSDEGYTLDTKVYNDYCITGMTVAAILLGGILALLTYLSYRQSEEKRKYYKDYFIKPEYTPPHDLSVAEMAENYIGSAIGNKKVATLMELAVNHKIELVKSEKDGAFGKKKTVWKIRIKTNKLKKEQAIVLKILAGSDTPLCVDQEITVKSHTATSELTELASDFGETITKKLEEAGYLEPTKLTNKEKSKKFCLSSIMTVLGVVWIIGWIGAILALFNENSLPNYLVLADMILLPVLIIVLVGVPIVVIKLNSKVSNIEKHTLKGLEYSRYMDGLKLYIKMAEADRLKMLQSIDGADTTHAGIVKVYEKLLPYAVVFGLEKSWLEELSHYYEFDDVNMPIWFVGMGTFSAHEFTSAMHSINTTTSSAIISSSSSSSSGGSGSFGGGGFSGGGGGGGGGGTW